MLEKGVYLENELLFFFFFTFYNCLFQLDLSSGKFGLPSSGEKLAATESRYPTYGACWVFYYFHNRPNSDMDYGIFNVHTDVIACNCTLEYTHTVRESALKVDSGRKIPCRTGESNLRRRSAGPVLYQLSYIPTPPYMY